MQTVIPMLTYQDPAAAIDWLCRTFGFKEDYRLAMPDGSIAHAELSLNGSKLALAGPFDMIKSQAPQTLGGIHTQLNWIVDDVDAHYQAAVNAGFKPASEPSDEFHGHRQYRAIDLEGHRWIFGQVKTPLSDKEIQDAFKTMMGG